MSHPAEPAGANQSGLWRRDAEPAGITPVTDAELDEVERHDSVARDAAERLARLGADLELRNELAFQGFTGAGWEVFVRELARYGLAVVKAWLANGEMFHQCTIKNCHPGGAPPWWTEDDREGLAHIVVAEALRTFRQRALIGGGWSYQGGASLKTYFIGTCVFEFPNPFRKWKREEEKVRKLLSTESLLASGYDCPSLGRDPADTAVDSVVGWAEYDVITTDRTKKIILLTALQYSASEVAEIMQVSKKSVEMVLANQRKRVNATYRRRRS
jgi:DNA-directed RNA polymerase specialized sigma24 family protein